MGQGATRSMKRLETQSMAPIRTMESYSGTGGMHLALKMAELVAQVVVTLEISPIANLIYLVDFTSINLQQKNIKLSKEFNDVCFLLHA